MTSLRAALLTALAMVAFAANSLLCRVALRDTAIDAVSFTSVRLLAGALTLWLIVALRSGKSGGAGSWASAAALFAYAIAFSLAYRSLSAAAGALLLFGAVQATMIGHGLWSGERLRGGQWLGLALALGGLAGLLLPGWSAPPLAGAALMIAAAGGILFLGESLTLRLALASLAILGGHCAGDTRAAAAAALKAAAAAPSIEKFDGFISPVMRAERRAP